MSLVTFLPVWNPVPLLNLSTVLRTLFIIFFINMKNLRYIVKVYIGSHKGSGKSPLNRVLEHRALAELPSIQVSPYTSSSVRTPKRFSISNQFSNEYLRYNGCKKSLASRIFDLFKGSRIWSTIFVSTIVLLKPNHSRRWFKSQQAFHLAVHFQDDWGVLSETYFSSLHNLLNQLIPAYLRGLV